MERWKLLNLD